MLSCGPYSFSGTTLTGLETVYIPVFENETIEYGLGQELADRITESFVSDNTLKISLENEADAVLSGKVTLYERSSYTYNKEDEVQEYKVDITVAVKFQKPDGSLIWEEPGLSAFGVFDAVNETEEEGKTKALKKLAEIIVNRTVRDW